MTIKPLRNLCLEFVTKHIYAVESLIGFPDLIGQQLFLDVIECHKTNLTSKNLQNCRKVFMLFANAYGEQVLSNLSLCHNIILLEKFVNVWLDLKCIRKLYLCHCKIGDDHDMLEHISQLKL